MEVLTAVFCDDDAAFRGSMRRTVTDLFAKNGVELRSVECASAEELSRAMGHMIFGLLFLDIDMPQQDGIRFGEQLRALGSGADIIFVSNMDDRVYDVFRVHPWCFVRKSRFGEEIGGVVREYVQTLHSRVLHVTLQGVDGQVRSVRPEDIHYVESAGKVQKLFLRRDGEPFCVRSSLYELEETLSPQGFLRIHKGFLVNYRCIRKITSRAVILDSGEDLPIGRGRLEQTRERYLALMKWKGALRGS